MLKCKFRVYSFYTLYNLLNMSIENSPATLPWGFAGNPEKPLLSTKFSRKNKKDFPKREVSCELFNRFQEGIYCFFN